MVVFVVKCVILELKDISVYVCLVILVINVMKCRGYVMIFYYLGVMWMEFIKYEMR